MSEASNKSTIERYAQLISNVGVIAGLVFLGIQLVQDRQLKEAELAAAAFTDEQQRRFALMGDNPAEAVGKVLDGKSLSTTERVVVNSYFGSRRMTWIRSSQLETMDVISSEWRNGFHLSSAVWGNEYGLDQILVTLDSEAHLLVPEFVLQLRVEYERLRKEVDEHDP